MKILATFVNFTYDPEVMELAHAWDEYAVDNNPTGYDDSLQQQLNSYGSDLLRSVAVEIEVPEGAIYAALNPEVQVAGDVVSVEEVTR